MSVLGHPNSTWQSCIFHPFPPLAAARLEVPASLAAVHSGFVASPALFTAVPDVQHLAGAPMTWEHKYLLSCLARAAVTHR